MEEIIIIMFHAITTTELWYNLIATIKCDYKYKCPPKYSNSHSWLTNLTEEDSKTEDKKSNKNSHC